ncbi:MAG: gliding motility-associated C-terminal domain-containing protein [Bacteroidota bacterium]
MNRLYFSLSLLLLLCWGSVWAQPTYTMSNNMVDDCKGTLLSSGQGTLPGHYDHNENYTFTVCVPGARRITLTFAAFCTELDFDSLRVFDGADTLAPQIGPGYSGTNLPPTISSTDSCITLNFISDANITCTGWVIRWKADVDLPVLPNLALKGLNPPCSTTSVVATFDRPVHCDSVSAGSFSLGGPIGNSVTNASPVNCVGDSTTQVQLTFAPGLNQSGFYTVTYTNFFLDQCDSLWTLVTSDTILVNDCPLEVDPYVDSDTICEGSCTKLYANASGGDFLTYQYSWSPTLPATGGPINICPTTTTVYTVTVTDGAGSTPATGSVRVVVLPAPSMPAAQTVCESDAPFMLTATPAGGSWSGPGIDSNGSGMFDPDDAGPGVHTVVYDGPNGCPGIVVITVREIDAGPPQAACPGTGPFSMTGFSPAGGIWSGPNITANGRVTPTANAGTFTVTYTFNGCSDTKEINIDTITISPIDTICESAGITSLIATPVGGVWVGNGITNPVGRFDPERAGGGTHRLQYQISGCQKEFDIFVKAISVGDNLLACPLQPAFTLPAPTPPGGYWKGLGITDSLLGIFDPQVEGRRYNDTLLYVVDGCSARQIVRVRYTEIGEDTLSFCPSDESFELNFNNTGRSPWNGDWTGAGVTDPNFPGDFDPSIAGPGFHTLVYTANTCADSMVMEVFPPTIPTDTLVCEGTPPFSIITTLPGGSWQGPGIGDTTQGRFDPRLSGVGVHTVYYLPPTGCLDSIEVEVYRPPSPNFTNLAQGYCYKDTNYVIIATPAGGTFTGPGMTGNIFNPAAAGPGQHTITYRVGQGECAREVEGIVTVGDPLSLQMAFIQDSICFGEFVTLSATASGGATGNIRYTWNQGLGEGRNQPVSPEQTTVYTLVVTDGCTQPLSGQVTVFVAPQFELSFRGSGPVCFGEQGYAIVEVDGPNLYAFEWNTNPPFGGDSLAAPTGFNYVVTVTDLLTRCQDSDRTEITSFPFVRANFNVVPNAECVTMDDPVVQLLDLSTGGTVGQWNFGDGTTAPYTGGSPPPHTYPAVQQDYTVSLVLSVDGNCPDTATSTACVVPPESGIAIPSAFSPNGDQINDVFLPLTLGVSNYRLQIFDRWGRIVFETDDPAQGWDGTRRGSDVPEGVYVYLITGLIIDNNPDNNYLQLSLKESGTVTLIR